MEEASINRNIVECKDVGAIVKSSLFPCINRNIVECKDYCLKNEWHYQNVLIETLWNVKTFHDWQKEPVICINRNIVECKGKHRSLSTADSRSINRNIVECKVTSVVKHSQRALACINRNIVECKGRAQKAYS